MYELDRLCDFAYQLFVPKQVITEIKKIAESSRGKEKTTAELTLQVLESLITKGKIKVKIVRASDGDGALLKLDKKNHIIATLDSGLRKKLKNAKLLGIKQFKYLYFV
jgi:rRNA-processing protein FCF1